MSFRLALLIVFLSLCNARTIKTRIAILGGGMAGVTAARTLAANGITDFLIIEAESVLGGRMKETKFGSYTIKLGANWIQGIQNNKIGKVKPIWTLAKKT
ncbi:unnamed protein product [Rotaria sp. Silwood2]|nr:unnamed protein product [Rotaria sp. Silwood2]CAF4459819.1 unnamed protein product [Rotaria sp. Silwood2]